VINLLVQRDRLVRRTARLSGLSFTALSAVCILIPGAVPGSRLIAVITLFLVLAFCQVVAGFQPSLGWQFGTIASGIAAIISIRIVSETAPTAAAIAAIQILGAAAIGSVAIVLTMSRRRIAILLGSFSGVLAVVYLATSNWENPLRTVGLVVVGWTLSSIVGLWILAGVPNAHSRITSIGLAHQAQRRASELEAQRRQSARLLHDTVLSTLTLLAHAGVGVSPKALRQQAAEDSELLRQLRMGGSPAPLSSGEYNLEQTGVIALGTTLTAVKHKFGRLGLAVSWHGSGEIHLQPAARDALLLALAECLENVRRHSGVAEASVTIIEDEATVTAMVTDAGIGFVLADVDSTRLGFSESIVARLRDAGGHARVFAAVGAGTTVVLEVPR
jgi:signal transduction histidine kinase